MSCVETRSVVWDRDQVRALVASFGTPLYLYQEKIIKDRFEALAAALQPVKPLICYAMKANSNLSILRLLHRSGAGFDIVSGGELKKVIAACGDATRVVFSGVAKTADEIELALQSKIKLINVESPAELDAIERIAARRKERAPIALRINPDVAAKTHHHLTTGTKANKFGMSIQDALEQWERKKHSSSLQFLGLDCHIGSQITEVAPLKAAYERVLEVATTFRSRGAEITTLDLGGGLGISYSGRYQALDVAEFGRTVSTLFKDFAGDLIFEPGRYLIAEAGALVTKVIYRKENQGKKFLIVDAGMNDLMRPAMYDSFHAIEVIGTQSDREIVDVVGPVCESSCYFAKERELPRAEADDLLLIRDAGAYGFAMSSTYNVRAQPAEVLIGDTGEARLVRRRLKVEDLWSAEQ